MLVRTVPPSIAETVHSWRPIVRRIEQDGIRKVRLEHIDRALCDLVHALRQHGENDAKATARLMAENEDCRTLLTARGQIVGRPIPLPPFRCAKAREAADQAEIMALSRKVGRMKGASPETLGLKIAGHIRKGEDRADCVRRLQAEELLCPDELAMAAILFTKSEIEKAGILCP